MADRVLLGLEPEPAPRQAVQQGRDASASTLSVAEEDSLIARLREGEEEAYEVKYDGYARRQQELIERFQGPVYNLVCRLLDEPDEAPDVVQEVFLKVFRNVLSFRNESSLKTWVYRIAVNESHNQRRWFMRHRRKEVGLELLIF